MKAHQMNKTGKLNEGMADMLIREIASLRHVIQSVTANISVQREHGDQGNRKGKRRQKNK